jgi:hypothetical protein
MNKLKGTGSCGRVKHINPTQMTLTKIMIDNCRSLGYETKLTQSPGMQNTECKTDVAAIEIAAPPWRCTGAVAGRVCQRYIAAMLAPIKY